MTEKNKFNTHLHVAIIIVIAMLSSCSENKNQENVAADHRVTAILPVDTDTFSGFVPDPTFGGSMNVTSASGPMNITRGVLLAKNGEYWFGSWNGLYSYDGTTFTNHTLKNGLSHHRVYHVYEDSKGNIWASTAGAGVYRYDGISFTNFSMHNGLPSNNVFITFEDKAGNMWFGSDSGATQYDYKSFRTLNETDSLPCPVYAFAESESGHLWFGTRRGTFQFQEDHISELTADNGAAIPCLALMEDNLGRIWIAGSNGLHCWYRKNDEQIVFERIAPNPSTHLAAEGSNILFVCGSERPNSLDGMYIMRYTGNAIDTVTQRTGQTGAGAQIFGLAVNEEGEIWYGCVQGLCKVTGQITTEYYKR